MFEGVKAWARKKRRKPEPVEEPKPNGDQERARVEYENQLSALKRATQKRKSRTLSDVRDRIDSSDRIMQEALGKP